MLIDKQLEFSKNQAVTVAAASTNVIDFTSGADIAVGEPIEIYGHVTETVTAAGAATVTIAVQVDDNEAFSSAKTLYTTAAIGKATLVKDYNPFVGVVLPRGAERYMRLYYTIGTGPLTAGKFTAGLVLKSRAWKALPDSL